MRALAITGMEQTAWMPWIISGSDMRLTPPSLRISEGTAFERHDGHGAGIFGDAGLFGVDDVHDDAALEHLGEPTLDEGLPVDRAWLGRDWSVMA